MNLSHRSSPRVRRAAAPLAVASALVALLLLASCASPDAGGGAREDKEYRTGSNLPVRDRSKPSEVKTYDPTSVENAGRGSPPAPPAGMRGG